MKDLSFNHAYHFVCAMLRAFAEMSGYRFSLLEEYLELIKGANSELIDVATKIEKNGCEIDIAYDGLGDPDLLNVAEEHEIISRLRRAWSNGCKIDHAEKNLMTRVTDVSMVMPVSKSAFMLTSTREIAGDRDESFPSEALGFARRVIDIDNEFEPCDIGPLRYSRLGSLLLAKNALLSAHDYIVAHEDDPYNNSAFKGIFYAIKNLNCCIERYAGDFPEDVSGEDLINDIQGDEDGE